LLLLPLSYSVFQFSPLHIEAVPRGYAKERTAAPHAVEIS
jgi:hypothetical protein